MSSPNPPGLGAHDLYERGVAHLKAGDPQSAAASLREAARLEPGDARILYQLGNSLRLSGEPEQAAAALQACIDRDASLLDAWFSLAFLRIQQGAGQQAEALLLALCQRFPGDLPLHHKTAGLMADFGRYAAAAGLYERITAQEPDRAGCHQRLGLCYQKLGRYPEAAARFQRAIDLDPNSGPAYLLLANTRRMTAADAPLLRLFEAALRRPGLAQDTRICIHFGLGKMHDDRAQYGPASGHYRHANELRHRQVHFDRGEWRAFVLRLMDAFARMRFEARPASWDRPAPGFVLGMLRSGTTLVERILTSHAAVHGSGETELLDACIQRIAEFQATAYPECLLRLRHEDLRAIADDYCRQLAAGKPAASFILDKNPLNFMHTGLIALLFPQAPIIHCRREPRDTCLSIYFQNFAHPRNNYAYDLHDIAAFYAGYEKLMGFWETLLPGRLIQVHYEKLVAEPAAMTQELYAAIGLTWTPDAILPQENPASISTASLWQARQPIHRHSVERWRNYAKLLPELDDALAESRAFFER
ncbi:MAG: sulfotransferase [Gammaproteobacteria bacterium]|nr:sulfotransferase [Gammaproteobacteria bacterium]